MTARTSKTSKTSKNSTVRSDLLLSTWGTLEKSDALLKRIVWAVMVDCAERTADGETQDQIAKVAGVSRSLVSGMLKVHALVESGKVAAPATTRPPAKATLDEYGLSADLPFVSDKDGAALISLRRRLNDAKVVAIVDDITGSADTAPNVTGLVDGIVKYRKPRTSVTGNGGGGGGQDFRTYIKMAGGALAARMALDPADNEDLTPDQVIQVLADYAHGLAAIPADDSDEDKTAARDALLGKAIAKHGSRRTRKTRTRKAA